MATKPEVERLAILETEIKAMKETLDRIDKKLDTNMTYMNNEYVHRSEFETVKRIVYGAVTLILLTVFGAVLRLVVL